MPPGAARTDRTATLTPVAVPTSPPTGSPVLSTPVEWELAPGVTGTGVVDPFALATTHRRTLRDRSFRLVRTLNLTRQNGTLVRRTTRRATVAPNASRLHVVYTGSYPIRAVAPRIELWWAGGPALFRLSGDGDVQYRRADDVALAGLVGELTLEDRIAGLLSVTDTRVVGREPDDPVRVILVADGVGSESVLRLSPFLRDPRNVTVSLEVDIDGVVYEYRIAYDATLDGEGVRVVRRARFTFVEEPAEPPAWADEARDEPGITGPVPATSTA